MALRQVGAAQFSRGLRGYVPAEVDAAVADLTRRAQSAEARAVAAERERDQALAAAERALRSAQAAQQERERAEAQLAARPVSAAEPAAQPAARPRTERAAEPAARPRSELRAGPDVEPGSGGPTRGTPLGLPAFVGGLVWRRWTVALVGLVLLAAVALLTRQLSAAREDDPPAPLPAAAPAPVPPVAGAPVVPEGWTVYREAGSTFAVPPDWKPEGTGTGRRWVSLSGRTQLRVLTAPASVPGELEASLAAGLAGYARSSSGSTTFRGSPALTWDYTAAPGGVRVRGSGLAVVIGGTGYQLQVQSQDAVWPTVQPLLAALRGSFLPGG